jgi:hypothetical protein
VPRKDLEFLLVSERAIRQQRVPALAAAREVNPRTVYRWRAQIMARLRSAALDAA